MKSIIKRHNLARNAQPPSRKTATSPGREVVAVATLVSFLLTNVVFPTSVVMAQSRTAYRSPVPATRPSQIQIPPAPPRLHVSSSERVESPAYHPYLGEIEESDTLSEAFLRRAGKTERLVPTSSADIEFLTRNGANAQVLRARVVEDTAFGQALQLWNAARFSAATEILQQSVEEFPDSPWTAESKLMLGDAARGNGAFNQAQDYYEDVLKSVSAPKNQDQLELRSKTMLRISTLQMAEGHWNEATSCMKGMLGHDADWRRRTWARHWLRMAALYRLHNDQLLACGPKAVGVVLASMRKSVRQQDLTRIPPSSRSGYSFADLAKLSSLHGLNMRGVWADSKSLQDLPVPFIAHLGFQGISGSRNTAPNTSEGHFVVVRKVSETDGQVLVADPENQRVVKQTREQFAREWTGRALVIGDQVPKRIAFLPQSQMRLVRGGVGAVALKQEDLGPGGDIVVGHDSPGWFVNKVTLNLGVSLAPLSYRPARGPAVSIGLTYNSQDAGNTNNPFGRKWAFNYGSYVEENPSQGLTIYMPDGRQDRYTFDGSEFVAEAALRPFLSVNQLDTHKYELRFQSGTKYIYGIPAGTQGTRPYLVQVIDPWGYSLDMGYDTSNHLTTITDADGKVTQLHYNTTGLVDRIDDPFGRHAAFTYDGNDNLTAVSSIDGQTDQFAYDAEARMTQFGNEHGVWQFQHQVPGRETDQEDYLLATDPLGSTELFSYEGDAGPVSYSDKRGNVTRWSVGTVIDGKGKVTQATYANGDHENWTYDPSTALPLTFVNARQKTTSVQYNDQGNPTSVTDPLLDTTAYNFAPNGMDLSSIVNAKTQTTYQFSNYTPQHQPQSVVEDPNGVDEPAATTQITYTDWGALATVTGPTQRVLTYQYDPASHRLASVNQGNATMKTITRDSMGRIRTSADSTGRVYTFDYSDPDRISRLTYPDGSFERYEYDIDGQISVFQNRAGQKAYYDYDVLGRLIREQDTAGASTRYIYDKNGNLTQLIDGNGNVTAWNYDSLDRVIRKIYADGNFEQYTYDGQDNVLTRRDCNGKTTSYTYDSNDNLTDIDYPTSPDVHYVYNELDQLVHMDDAVGATDFNYTVKGAMKSEDGPWANDTVSYTYYPDRTRHTTAVGGSTLATYTYDSLGRFQTTTGSTGTFSYNYTHAGHPELDNADLVAKLTSPNGTTTTYTYDSDQRLTSIWNQLSSGSTLCKSDYTFNNLDKRTNIVNQILTTTDPASPKYLTLTDSLSYDAANRLAGMDSLTSQASGDGTLSSDRGYSFQHDSVGNIVRIAANSTISNTNSNANSSGLTEETIYYECNPLNQQSRVSLENQAVSMASGVTTRSSAALSTPYAYDNNGSSASVGSDQSSIYKYDDDGRLIQVLWTNTGGAPPHTVAKTDLVYDGLGRLRITRDWIGSGTTSGGYTWTTRVNANSGWFHSEVRRICDGMLTVEERGSSNQVIGDLLRGPDISNSLDGGGGIGGLLARTRADASGNLKTFYFYYNGTGDPIIRTDTSGVLDTGKQPYAYKTKEICSNARLSNFGYRFAPLNNTDIDPLPDPWLTRDPAGEGAGVNLYSYCDGDPVNNIDFYGRNVAVLAIGGGYGYLAGAGGTTGATITAPAWVPPAAVAAVGAAATYGTYKYVGQPAARWLMPDDMETPAATFIPAVPGNATPEKYVPGSLKRSASWASELAKETYDSLKKISGDPNDPRKNKASKMKKLMEQAERLLEKIKSKK